MIDSSRFCGLILAAGASTRMGRDKALLPWPPNGKDTLLSAAIRAFSTFSQQMIVVVGRNAGTIGPLAQSLGGSVAVNSASERGQFSSLQCGLQQVWDLNFDAAIITLVDKPPVKKSTLEKLYLEFNSQLPRGKWAVVPECAGRHGHPIVIDRQMIEVFLKAPVTSNAREVQHQNLARIQYVPVDDIEISMNLNTPEDYARLSQSP
jgi:CTP:molybdopterin cytidylyltransferase MocA